jgi:methionyl-tRNA formyltransferase
MSKIRVATLGKGHRFRECLKVLSEYTSEVLIGPNDLGNINYNNVSVENNFEEFLNKLSFSEYDYVFCIGYGSYINPKNFSLNSTKWINFHASLIPFYRGGSPLNWAIINGEENAGMTMLEMTSGLDTGPVIMQKKFDIKSRDINDVVKIASKQAVKLLVQFLSNHEALWNQRKPQTLSVGSHYTTRTKIDSKISFSRFTDKLILRYFAALKEPIPLPWFNYKDKIVCLGDVRHLTFDVFGPPGRVAGFVQGKFVVVAQNRGIEIRQIIVDEEKIHPSEILETGTDAN